MLKILTDNRLKNYSAAFAFFLMFSFGVVLLLAPIIGSHADTVNIGAEVNEVISISTSDDDVQLSLVPSGAGSTTSGSVDVSVSTNSAYGYELYFSSVDENTAMTSDISESTISSNFETTALANLPSNSWGYSLDNTDFTKIPAFSAQARIKKVDHLPTGNEMLTTTHFGTKVTTTLPSGTYSKDVVFSAVTGIPPVPVLAMQTFSCSSLGDVNDTEVLTDLRDGNTYTVKKLADNKCWMVENLKLEDYELSSADSNIPSGETFTLPIGHNPPLVDGSTSDLYIDATYGGYYNYYAATAGWGTGATIGNSPKDICPKGWHLPTGDSNGDFATLKAAYTNGDLFTDAGYSKSGVYSVGDTRNSYLGITANYWTSTVTDSRTTKHIFVMGTTSFSGDTSISASMTIRCLTE